MVQNGYPNNKFSWMAYTRSDLVPVIIIVSKWNYHFYSSLAGGQILELCFLPASFQAVYFFLNRFFKGVPKRPIYFPLHLNTFFFRILPRCVEALEAWGASSLFQTQFFFSFAIIFVLRHHGKLSSTQQICS